MIKKLSLPAKIIIAIGFIMLFYHRVSEMQTAYIKFALIDFIYHNNLQFLFYVLTVLELTIALGIFFVHKKTISTVIDIGFAIYLLFIGGYFMVLLKTANGCIECNYTTHFFNENIKITLGIIVGLFLLYAFLVRGRRYTKAGH